MAKRVGAVCSGLRSLIALISFGMLFAYITPVSKTKKTILFLATIPASFLANLARVLTLALVTYQWNAQVATKDVLWDAMESTPFEFLVIRSVPEPVHDFTGIMIFVVAFAGLFSIERLLTYLEGRFGRSRSDFWCVAVASAVVWHATGIWLLLFQFRASLGWLAWPLVIVQTLLPYAVLFLAWRQTTDLYNWTKERDGIGPLLTSAGETEDDDV